jgi:hypothetical protein
MDAAAFEMPRYKSHKQVWALEIGAVDGRKLTFVEKGYEAIEVEQELFARYIPVHGDFLVVYADGYKSFSPRKAFLEGYKPEESPRGEAPQFMPNTVVVENALVVDRCGIAWWVRLDGMKIIKADPGVTGDKALG